MVHQDLELLDTVLLSSTIKVKLCSLSQHSVHGPSTMVNCWQFLPRITTLCHGACTFCTQCCHRSSVAALLALLLFHVLFQGASLCLVVKPSHLACCCRQTVHALAGLSHTVALLNQNGQFLDVSRCIWSQLLSLGKIPIQ